MTRVTRHPMLWSFAIWAAVHVIGNGDIASIVFFGAFLVTALAGMPSIDAKLARRDPATWQALSAATSIVPFAAIAAGRNRFVAREFGWLTPAIAVVAWVGAAAAASAAVRCRAGRMVTTRTCHAAPVIARSVATRQSPA